MEIDNIWVEFCRNGITNPDQVDDYKDWLACRRASLDQLKKRWDEAYSYHQPSTNLFRLDQIESAEFRLEIDRWALDQFLLAMPEEGDSWEDPGI